MASAARRNDILVPLAAPARHAPPRAASRIAATLRRLRWGGGNRVDRACVRCHGSKSSRRPGVVTTRERGCRLVAFRDVDQTCVSVWSVLGTVGSGGVWVCEDGQAGTALCFSREGRRERRGLPSGERLESQKRGKSAKDRGRWVLPQSAPTFSQRTTDRDPPLARRRPRVYLCPFCPTFERARRTRLIGGHHHHHHEKWFPRARVRAPPLCQHSTLAHQRPQCPRTL